MMLVYLLTKGGNFMENYKNNGNYKLGFFETMVFKSVMNSALNIQNLLDEMAEFTKTNGGRPNGIIKRMRNALQQYLTRVEGYMDYIGCTDKLTYGDYERLLKFLKSMMDINAHYAKFLASSFGKVMDEEAFPVLKCTEEYKKLMVDLTALETNIKDFSGTATVLEFLGYNLIGFASRSQILYDANPLSKGYDHSDENINYLANRFYMNCLSETSNIDIFGVLSRKNAFDDFVKENTLNNDQGPKLNHTKKN